MGNELTIDQRVRKTQAHRAKVSDGGRSVLQIPKVAAFLDRMLLGDKITDAALAVGLRANRARRLMGDPAVRREYMRRCEELRENERARNILLYSTVRDRGLESGATAAQQKVAIEAARTLLPEDASPSITINGGQNVIAGYVIKLPPPGEGPRKIVPPGFSRDAEDV
jgi:hypothetical protein